MRTSRKVGIALTAVVLLTVAILTPRWYTTFKIKSQVSAQLLSRLPHTVHEAGQDLQPQRVEILSCRRSDDGRRYEVRFVIRYRPEASTESGCLLTRDEWGTYRGEWRLGTNSVSLAVE